MTVLSLNEALNKFGDSLSTRGKSVNTIVAYKGDINQLIGFLSSKCSITTLDGVTAKSVEDFKKDLSDNGYTAKSVSRKLNSIKNFFRILKEKGWFLLTHQAKLSILNTKMRRQRF